MNIVNINKSHNNYISIAKAIGIICVVIWHSRPPIIVGIYFMLFAVPIFLFTSGIFFKPANTFNDYITFCNKRVKGLYLPFIKWSLFFLLFHNIFIKLNIYNNVYGYNGQVSYYYSFIDFIYRIKSILLSMSGYEQLLGAFWFIKCLFLASLLIGFIQIVFLRFSNINVIHFVLPLIGLSWIAIHYKIVLPIIGNLGLVLYSSLFYLLGHCYHYIENNKFYNLWSFLIFAIISLLGLIFYDSITSLINIDDTCFFSYFVFSLSGILMILNISKFIEKYSIKSLFYYIGDNTFIILALHFISMKLVSLLIIYIYNLPIERLAEFPVISGVRGYWWILYSIFGVFFPLFLNELFYYFMHQVNRYKQLNRTDVKVNKYGK